MARDRFIRINIAPPTGRPILLTERDLKFTFEVNSGADTKQESTLKIYNLTYDNVTTFNQLFTTISIEAGWHENAGKPFIGSLGTGEVTNSRIQRDGTSLILKLNFIHLGARWDANVKGSFIKGQSLNTVLSSLATQADVTISATTTEVLKSTLVASGTFRDVLLELLDQFGLSYIDDVDYNGTITVFEKGKSTPSQVVLITAETGLIGFPKYESIGTIEVDTILNPNLTLGSFIEVNTNSPVFFGGQITETDDAYSKGLTELGVYEVTACQHSGGNWSDEYKTRVTGILSEGL